MSHELWYTSAPQGLQPNTRGFCTVKTTPGIPQQLVQRLEALSGYQHLFPAHDDRVAQNPVVYQFLRVPYSGKQWYVMTRICDAGLDYSGRSNKFAHHIVLEPHERPAGGPAWLARQPGFFEKQWDGKVGIVATSRPIPQGDRPPQPCRLWEQVKGDAGWAGVLAESLLSGNRQPAILIAPLGLELLPLLEEALALLPVHARWEATFCTYFTSLPPDVDCWCRVYFDGTREAKHERMIERRLIIDLTQLEQCLHDSAAVKAARLGCCLEPETTEQSTILVAPVHDATPSSLPKTFRSAPVRPSVLRSVPPPKPVEPFPPEIGLPQPRFQSSSNAKWLAATAATLLLGLLVGVTATLILLTQIPGLQVSLLPSLQVGRERQPDGASPADQVPRPDSDQFSGADSRKAPPSKSNGVSDKGAIKPGNKGATTATGAAKDDGEVSKPDQLGSHTAPPGTKDENADKHATEKDRPESGSGHKGTQPTKEAPVTSTPETPSKGGSGQDTADAQDRAAQGGGEQFVPPANDNLPAAKENNHDEQAPKSGQGDTTPPSDAAPKELVSIDDLPHYSVTRHEWLFPLFELREASDHPGATFPSIEGLDSSPLVFVVKDQRLQCVKWRLEPIIQVKSGSVGNKFNVTIADKRAASLLEKARKSNGTQDELEFYLTIERLRLHVKDGSGKSGNLYEIGQGYKWNVAKDPGQKVDLNLNPSSATESNKPPDSISLEFRCTLESNASNASIVLSADKQVEGKAYEFNELRGTIEVNLLLPARIQEKVSKKRVGGIRILRFTLVSQ